jgi:hypothetical protein
MSGGRNYELKRLIVGWMRAAKAKMNFTTYEAPTR